MNLAGDLEKTAKQVATRVEKAARTVGQYDMVEISPELAEQVIEKVEAHNKVYFKTEGARKISLGWMWGNVQAERQRLKAMGIENEEMLRAAVREFIRFRAGLKQADKAKQLERSLIGKNVGIDFFPTPKSLAARMVADAGIEEGMKVLEPSAGNGNIAEAIRETDIEPDVVEVSSSLREVLEAKGFNIVGQDFMDVEGQYDRIIMNPPFSKNQDIEHVRHAYELLKPGGRVVAIMGEGAFFRNDKAATEFRDWLEEVGGTEGKLPEGTFTDRTLMNTTGVNARLVTIDKTRETPKGVEMYSVEREAVRSGASFVEQLDDFAAGKIPNRMEQITIGETPRVLQMLGAEPLPLVVTQGTIEKATEGKHGISIETLKDLPGQLADPVMVFDSATEADSLVVMTELKQDGKSIVAAIRLSKEMGRNVVNDIVSVHPRTSEYHFINWINQGLLRYMNRIKSRAWSVTSGLQLPAVRGSKPGFNKKILFDSDLVKENYSGAEARTPTWTLADVKRIFKGQEVVQPGGGPGSPIFIKTRGGQYLTISSVTYISPDEVSFQLSHGEKFDPKTMTITGAYGDGEIRMVKGKAGTWTLAHESTHFMEDAGIIKSGDVAILRGYIRRMVRDGKRETANKNDIGGAEDRANFIASELTAEKPVRGFVGRVVDRIREFVDRLGEMLGLVPRTAQSVVRDIKSGMVFKRGLTGDREGATSYDVTPKKGTANIPPETTPKTVGGKQMEYSFSDPRVIGFNPSFEAGTRPSIREEIKERGYEVLSSKELLGIGTVHGGIVTELKYKKPGDLREYYAYVLDNRPDIDSFTETSLIAKDKLSNDIIQRMFEEAQESESKLARAKLSIEKNDQAKMPYWINEVGAGIDARNKAAIDKHGSFDKAYNSPDWDKTDRYKEAKRRHEEYLNSLPNPSRPPKSGGQQYTYTPADMARGREILLNKEPSEWTDEEKAFIQEKGGAIEFMAERARERAAGYQYSVEKILSSKEKYSASRKQTDPPGPHASPETARTWILDNTDAAVQTILNKLPSRLPHMTLMEKILKSPEWFSHPQVNRIVRLFMRDRNELYHEYMNYLNDLGQPQADEGTVSELAKKLKGKGLPWAQRLKGESSKEYQDLLRYIDQGDTQMIKAEDLLPIMQRERASEDTIRTWKAMRESYDKALDLMTKQMREMQEAIEEEAAFKGIKPVDYSPMYQTLKGALKMMQQWRGSYAPRIRQGNWAVVAKRGEERYREHRFSEFAARRLAEKLKREGWEIQGVSEIQRIPEDVYQDISAVSVAKAIEATVERMSKEGTTGPARADSLMKFNEDLLAEVADMIRARGFRSSMIHRTQGPAVRGYIEDPLERHLVYINNLSRGFAKAKVAGEATNELLGRWIKGRRFGGIDPTKEPRAYTVAKDYIQEQLRNLDSTDRLIGLAKSVTTLRFLGFSARAAIINMTAMVTTAPVSINQYVGNGRIGFMKINRELAKAGKDFASYMAGKGPKEGDEVRFLDEEKRLGWDDPQYTRDAMNNMAKLHNKTWSLTMDAAMYLFGKTEQWNRGATMLAAYRMARKDGKNHDEASELAKTASDKAHGVYGRSTLPAVAWGRNPAAKIAQMLYVYSKFAHNYLQMLYDVGAKKHNIKGFLYGLLSPVIIGGLASLPFKDQAWMPLIGLIMTALGMKDKDEDPEKVIWKLTRDKLGDKAEQAGRYGLFGAMGMDISGSLSIGVGLPRDWWEVAGAIGGAAKEGAAAWEKAKQGRLGRAAEHLLPAGLANMTKAYRESKEGVTTDRERPLWDESGKPFRPTAAETLTRAAGARSSRQAMMQSRAWEGKREAANFQEERSDIYNRYRAYIVRTDKPKGEFDAIKKLVRDYNKRIRAAGLLKEVPEIKFSEMRTRIVKDTRQAGRRERARLQ